MLPCKVLETGHLGLPSVASRSSNKLDSYYSLKCCNMCAIETFTCRRLKKKINDMSKTIADPQNQNLETVRGSSSDMLQGGQGESQRVTAAPGRAVLSGWNPTTAFSLAPSRPHDQRSPSDPGWSGAWPPGIGRAYGAMSFKRHQFIGHQEPSLTDRLSLSHAIFCTNWRLVFWHTCN